MRRADLAGRKQVITAILSVYALFTLGSVHPVLAASLAYLRVFATVIGGLTGATLSLIPSLPAELLDERIAVLASAALLSPVGVGFVVGPTIAGQMSDISGSYAGAKALAGACLGVGALVVALLDCPSRCTPIATTARTA